MPAATKDKEMATLKILGLGQASAKRRRDLAAWLRRRAADVEASGEQYAKKFTARFYTAILAAILCLITASTQADTIEPYRSICQIQMSGGGQGSGTLIATNKQGQGLVLSCRHVCEYEGNRVLCSFLWAGGGDTVNGTVIKVVRGSNFDTDIALVVIDRIPRGVKARPVRSFELQKGPWIGAGFRSSVMRITGVIENALERPDGLIVFPTALIQGQSGGPLFNRRGEVVGVVVGSNFTDTSVAADGAVLRAVVAEFVR